MDVTLKVVKERDIDENPIRCSWGAGLKKSQRSVQGWALTLQTFAVDFGKKPKAVSEETFFSG